MKAPLSTLLAAAALAALTLGANPAAASWITPNLPTATSDQPELATSGAEAIVLGKFLYRRDYRTASGYGSSYIAVIPHKWLRGHVPGDTVLIGLSAMSDGSALRLRDLEDTRDSTAIFFLRFVRSGVLLSEEPWAYSGVLPASRSVVEEIEQHVARQQPDSLLARSDLVVVGRRVDGVRCPEWPTVACYQLVVDRTLKGSTATDTVLVAPWHIVDIPLDEGLFFLEDVGSGVYEPVAFRRGCLEVVDGQVSKLGVSVEDLAARASRLSK